MKHLLLTVIVIALIVAPALAQDKAAGAEPKKTGEAPKGKPAVVKAVVLRSAVDPYVPAVERARFFQASGKDNELTAEEFAADRKRTSPFVRKFDHWPMLIGFDKNGSKTIDWFEADMYRREVRGKVIEAFDTNKDRKLRGKERTAAAEALSSEKFLAARLGRGGPRPAFAGGYGKQMVERYDTNRDGEISEAERQKAFAEMRERAHDRMLAEYDKNGDGELDADERRAMRSDQQAPWKDKMREWQLRDYDLNNDGELDEKETAELKLAEAKFRKTMEGIGKEFQLRTTDINGDGEVSDEERRAVREKWQGKMFQVLGRFAKYADADGDGSASPDEWMTFRKRATGTVMNWMEGYGLRYDANDDGRLDAGEREILMKGLREDVDGRMTKYDANKDGHLEPDEVLNMAEGFLDEIGLRPMGKEDKEDDERRRR